MNFTQSFKLALKSLKTSKMRAFLTMLGIIIGVGAVIVILSLGNGMTNMMNSQFEKMGSNLIQVMTYGRGTGDTRDVDVEDLYELVDKYPQYLTGVTPYVSASAKVRYQTDDRVVWQRRQRVTHPKEIADSQSRHQPHQSSQRQPQKAHQHRRKARCEYNAYRPQAQQIAQNRYKGDCLKVVRAYRRGQRQTAHGCGKTCRDDRKDTPVLLLPRQQTVKPRCQPEQPHHGPEGKLEADGLCRKGILRQNEEQRR